jgi:ABC-type hemin transport system ATPase subunit
MISAEDISFDYDGNLVLADVGLVAQPGQMVGLIGPNGSGNTTLHLRHTYWVTSAACGCGEGR